MRVICVCLGSHDETDQGYSDGWLTIGREYIVLGVYGRSGAIKYRILGDERTPALHDVGQFRVLSSEIPSGWEFRLFDDQEWEITPAAFAGEGFWTAYFDGDPSARSAFDRIALELGVKRSSVT